MKKLIVGFFILVCTGVVAAAEKAEIVEVSVTAEGFVPSAIDVKPGKSVILNVTRKTDSTCATQIQVPSKKIKKSLPLNQMVSVDLGKLEKGEIRFGCGMNLMAGGRILVN